MHPGSVLLWVRFSKETRTMRTSLSGKFRPRRPPLATLLLLVTVVFSVRSLAGQQCLEVEVLDPSSAPVSNATVSIGNREQPTDGSGLAIFCELGASSHWIIVSAAGFQTKEASVQQAEGQITFVLQLATLSEDLVVVGTRTEGRDPLESSVPVERIRRRTPASLRRAGDRPGVADGVTLVQFLQFQHQRRHGRLTPGHPARPGPGPDVGAGQR